MNSVVENGDASQPQKVSVQKRGWRRRLFAFVGPAYLVSVGYMDPGNWATDIEGGARFGYTLIWVLLMSNLMAVLLQTLSARLGIVTGHDLAQGCRREYPRFVTLALWVLAEIAIAATDLAEALGTIVGLNLLFHLPLLWGCAITALDTFLFLALQRFGVRKMEAFILTLVATIGGCFLIEVVLSKPEWTSVFAGFVPRLDASALYIAIGIIGATVMPHNLYLHSALVQIAVGVQHLHREKRGLPLQPDRFGRRAERGLPRERRHPDHGGRVLLLPRHRGDRDPAGARDPGQPAGRKPRPGRLRGRTGRRRSELDHHRHDCGAGGDGGLPQPAHGALAAAAGDAAGRPGPGGGGDCHFRRARASTSCSSSRRWS